MSANGPTGTNTDTIQGITKEGLAEFNARMHAVVDEGKQANIVTLIARHGEIVNCDAYGVLDVSKTPPVPVKTDSIFRIASMTKPITAAAMMMLWEEGKWALEDPVSKFIPEFEGLKVKQDDGELVPQASPMTMRQLMSHSAGFGGRQEYPDLRDGDLQDMIDFLAQQPLFFQPGKGWRYGPSVDIQGYIMQKLTGQFVDVFLEERIFAPLGMVDSGFVLPPSKVDRLVNNHKPDDNGKLVTIDLPGTYNTSRPKFLGAGGGLMLSTVKDYWRFSQMILNGGEFEGKHYLKASTVEMMHSNVLEPGTSMMLGRHKLDGLGFGLGYAIVQDPALKTGQPLESYFWGGLYGTWFWIDPVNDMIVIGFINIISGTTMAGSPLLREVSARLIYKAVKEPSQN
ncbi:beta-lactamase/transpeptidase-like protein [Rhizodiscina lignyota]|uniref:Beta-lactamase/transpeptidase-like protein n=1 Tax=Rhizodiscina lignyota TaxID=1504668 RepID=A0A9P4M8I8_9PEZI|nr:beta-lactamase/transpeptidase-like protein [Rhizodiscina lignyota]